MILILHFRPDLPKELFYDHCSLWKSIYMFGRIDLLIEDDVTFLLLDYCITLKGFSKALFIWKVGIKNHICPKNLFVLK